MDNVQELLLQEWNEHSNHDLIHRSGLNAMRLAGWLGTLAPIGIVPEGGRRRLVFSKEERAAKEQLKQWIANEGFEVEEDAAGNVFGIWRGAAPMLDEVWTGSHVDTVPSGGAFDGALGVLGALEAMASLKEQGFSPQRTIRLVAFSDEEGARFGKGFFGSRAVMGEIQPEELHSVTDSQGFTIAEAMRADALEPEQLSQLQRPQIHGFLELHIEQGKVLESLGLAAGCVSAIAGPSWFEVTFTGSSDHAGTTPFALRRDALVGAATWIQQIPIMAQSVSGTAVATVGRVSVSPNGINVVPGEVRLTVDIRDIDEAARDRVIELVLGAAETIAREQGLGVRHQESIRIAPVSADESIREVIKQGMRELGFPDQELVSGAGHDSMILGKSVPFGMIFVRSLDGKSHSPAEWSTLADCLAGVAILKTALERVSSE